MIQTLGYMSAVRFVLVGGTSALLNLLLLWIFVSLFGLWYVSSSVVGYAIAAGYNFLLQRSWAFTGNGGRISVQVPQFAIVNLAGVLLNTAILCALVARLGTSYLMAQAMGSLAVALLSFFAYRRIFKQTE